MANSDKNILITPSVGLSTNPTIKFNGANNTPTTLRVLDDGTVSFEGTAGQLFSVADGMTGTIFSVNDVSGIPNIEVLDTALVKLNQYQGQSVFGSSAAISNTAGNPAQVSIVPKNQITPGLIIKHAPENTATITSITGSGSAVTYTALNTFSAGTYVTITGANPSAYNLTNAYIGNATSTQFTVSSTATGTYVSGGTATTVGPSNLNPIFEIQSSSGSSIFSIETSANNPTVKAFLFRANYFGASDNTITIGSYAGTYDIMGSTAASTILKVTGAPSQTANLQEWTSSGGQSLTRVRSSGQFGIGSVLTGTALVVNLDLLGAATQGIVIRGAASQTGDLALLQASDGTTLLRFNAQGQVQPLSTAGQAFTIKGVASQSLNLQEWQNSAGTVLARVDADGSLISPIVRAASLRGGDWVNAPSGTWATSSTSATASTVGIIIKGAASQTADLLQWQNSAGSLLGRVTANGNLQIAPNNGAVGYSLFVTGAYTGTPVVLVRGVASQTADLQQWQNSSSTTLLRVNNLGQIQAPQPASSGLVVKAAATLTATITNAIGNGTTVTYTAANTFTAGQTVTITAVDPVAYNLSSVTIATATTTTFTVTNAATGTYVSGGTATVAQSTDLQQWQSSAGSLLAAVNSAGNIFAKNNFESLSSDIYIKNTSGQVFRSVRAGAWTDSADALFFQVGANSDRIVFTANVGTAATRMLFSSAFTTISNYAYNTTPTPTAVTNLLSSTDTVVLKVQGSASQTANLQEWQASDGTVYGRFNAFGSLYVSNNTEGGTAQFGNTGFASASSVVLKVKGSASQTANLQEWQNSAGTNLATITNSGQVFTSQTLARYFTNRTNSGAYFDSELVSDSFVLEQRTTTAVNLIVKGMASQTGDLQQWRNSAGTVLAKIAADGSATLASGAVDISGGANFTIRNAGTTAYFVNASLLVGTGYSAGIGVIIRGNGSQTADLQQWQYSDGNTYARIAPYGQLAIGNVNPAIYANARISLNTVAADAVGMVIRGVSSQTANLTEWQNSSGTVLTNVGSNGNITAPGYLTANSHVVIGEQNSGGSIRMLKQTATGTSPGTDQGRLYFRDGTTAGTLKLVVRAGASGAETTILDNIPQS